MTKYQRLVNELIALLEAAMEDKVTAIAYDAGADFIVVKTKGDWYEFTISATIR